MIWLCLFGWCLCNEVVMLCWCDWDVSGVVCFMIVKVLECID